jgi:hypothetical protein
MNEVLDEFLISRAEAIEDQESTNDLLFKIDLWIEEGGESEVAFWTAIRSHLLAARIG